MTTAKPRNTDKGSRVVRLSSLFRDQRGTAITEFGLLAPIFFVLMLGIVDIGRGLSMHAAYGHAAQEGARYAAIHGDDSLAPVDEAAVRSFVFDRLTYNSPNVTVDVEYSAGAAAGSTVTVRVNGPFEYLIAGFENLLPFTISAQSSMTIL